MGKDDEVRRLLLNGAGMKIRNRRKCRKITDENTTVTAMSSNCIYGYDAMCNASLKMSLRL